MKRLYSVTIVIEVEAETEAEFARAAERFVEDPPHVDRWAAGKFGTFSARNHRPSRVTVRRVKP